MEGGALILLGGVDHALVISDFAQGNSTSHPSHPNINKTHDEINIITMLVQIVKIEGHKNPMNTRF